MYKNDIIANCLLDILTSGRSSSHIRDQIIAVLSHYNTETLNLDAIIHQPGYDRTLRQCLLIDEQGKMNAIFEVVKFLQQFENVNLEKVNVIKNFAYTLDDLYYALEFALISEGSINNDEAYKQNNILKTRLQSIINGEEKEIFEYSIYRSKEEFIKDMFRDTQLVNVNLSYLDDRFAKVMTKLYSKLLFNYTTSLEPRGQFSVNISKPGITKGQHWHNSKWEMFVVVSGHALIQERKIGSDEIRSFEVSGKKIEVVYILPGYTHSITNLSETEDLITIMWANEQFSPNTPDTLYEEV